MALPTAQPCLSYLPTLAVGALPEIEVQADG